MSMHNYAGVEVQLDDEGFLLDAGKWNDAVAEAIARDFGIALTPRHWEVIQFARKDYGETSQSPGLRRIASRTTVTMKELYALFPKGPGKLVARIAGLPKPKSCL